MKQSKNVLIKSNYTNTCSNLVAVNYTNIYKLEHFCPNVNTNCYLDYVNIFRLHLCLYILIPMFVYLYNQYFYQLT